MGKQIPKYKKILKDLLEVVVGVVIGIVKIDWTGQCVGLKYPSGQ